MDSLVLYVGTLAAFLTSSCIKICVLIVIEEWKILMKVPLPHKKSCEKTADTARPERKGGENYRKQIAPCGLSQIFSSGSKLTLRNVGHAHTHTQTHTRTHTHTHTHTHKLDLQKLENLGKEMSIAKKE